MGLTKLYNDKKLLEISGFRCSEAMKLQRFVNLKFILIWILLIIPFSVRAQVQKERRIYYLDCSYSMVTNKIWEDVCENLKNAIDDVDDETTELIVIPFALGHDGGLKVISATATKSGKEKLKNEIVSIVPSKSSMTFHSVPLQDFYANRVSPEKVTYMFLMTDGQDEHSNKSVFPNLLKQWGERYGDKNVYGFYVMLHKYAQNANISDICEGEKHLWKVETANINVNLVRLQNNAVFNARNDKYIELPIHGNIGSMKLQANFDTSSPYKVVNTKIENGKLKINVKFDGDVYSLPVAQVYPLSISMIGGGNFDFLVTDVVKVKCESKPERSLKISIR